ncbi:fimbrial protein [Cronobacter universalis]|uniref:fimbrial protein n=1 Tax=Cronobacter universalis TaxID=535744 RepID=UPI003CECB55E
MYKFVLLFFTVFLSLSALPAMAANCSGTIVFNADPSDKSYYYYGYTTDNYDPLFIGQFTIQDNMTCDPDYVENATPMGRMVMKMTGGGICKDPTTITTSYPGIEWKLEGMHCDGDRISSDRIQAAPWQGQITWPAGTVLGKAKLIVNDEYWTQSTQLGQYSVKIQTPTIGNTVVNNPAVNVTFGLGNTMTFNFKDTATCSMTLSTENMDFGRLLQSDINDGSLYKELSVYYSCKNKALINGLYIRFEPENVVDAANGIFSANGSDGRKLNFQIYRMLGNLQIIPLNENYKIFDPNRWKFDATERFRIYVKPSTSFPVGKVSTYMNVSLIYR